MKKPKSKKVTGAEERKPHSSQMDEFRDMWNEEDSKDGSSGIYVKLKAGKNTLRVLPNKDPDEPFFVSWAIHYGIGPTGEDKVRCIEPGGPFGHSKKKDKQRNYKARLCPPCKKYCRNKTKARAFPWQSPEGKSFWREHVAPWRARHRFAFGINLPKNKSKKKAKVLECGTMIAQPLIQSFYDESMGGDFTDPKTGRNVIITMKQLGKEKNEVEYKVNLVPDRTPLKLWPRIKKRLPDLQALLPTALEPDAIIAIMEGDGDSGDDDDMPRRSKKNDARRFKSRDDGDADLDDDVGDEDDEDASERRLKLGKRRRSRDEDVDPDAEEEDDDDVGKSKKSKKKKKSKSLRDKLKKKARRDD